MKATLTIAKDLASVWQALSSQSSIPLWYGSKGSSVKVRSMDFKPSGVTILCMTMPNGYAMWEKWTYTQIIPSQSIAFHTMITDENATRPMDISNMPSELSSTITIVAMDNKTSITVESKVANPSPHFLEAFAQNMEPMRNAWLSSLQKIEHIT